MNKPFSVCGIKWMTILRKTVSMWTIWFKVTITRKSAKLWRQDFGTVCHFKFYKHHLSIQKCLMIKIPKKPTQNAATRSMQLPSNKLLIFKNCERNSTFEVSLHSVNSSKDLHSWAYFASASNPPWRNKPVEKKLAQNPLL